MNDYYFYYVPVTNIKEDDRVFVSIPPEGFVGIENGAIEYERIVWRFRGPVNYSNVPGPIRYAFRVKTLKK